MCEYCQGDDDYRYQVHGMIVMLGVLGELHCSCYIPDDENVLRMELRLPGARPIEEDVEIKYCPMCGRKLGNRDMGLYGE